MNILKRLFPAESKITTEILNKTTTSSSKKSVEEIIEEIHDSFYTEVDKLLEQAKVSKSTETQYQELIDKANKLRSLGFSNTKECKEAQKEIDRLNLIKQENLKNANLVEAINYFNHKYPLHKFITEESVVKICNKYGLVYGSVDRYIGVVPTKNLKDMEKAKDLVKDEDAIFGSNAYGREFSALTRSYVDSIRDIRKTYDDKVNIALVNNDYFRVNELRRNYSYYLSKEAHVIKAPLEIAAPVKDFNMEGYELKGVKLSKIEIPDPVVLQPVQYKDVKYYLIITAWGLEASDELVVNNKYN